ncbi:DNA replication/repair protein RecF [Lachnospiraceae bacterium 62-35]
MFIESIELKNYRNYGKLHMDFSSGTNILYGDNAQGKTNVLEAVYVCSTTKSHRGSKDKEIIRFGEEESHIKIQIRKQDRPYRIDMHLKKSKTKGVAINGIPIKKASELFGIVNVVFFSPEDLNLIKNGPSERRKFIDLELCQLNKLYVHSLVRYNKVIIQRNKLLKELAFKPEYEETLDVWDMQMVHYGKEIIAFREEFIKSLNEIITRIHYRISGERENLTIHYEPDVSIEEFESAVKRNRFQDIRQKTTLTGPHRDDICFRLSSEKRKEDLSDSSSKGEERGIDIRKFGSQGQQRTAALSLKLAEIELVRSIIKDYPILLLDDVLSELDSSRQTHLLAGIKHIQTLITCTGLDEFVNHRFPIDKIFKVTDGKVINEN